MKQLGKTIILVACITAAGCQSTGSVYGSSRERCNGELRAAQAQLRRLPDMNDISHLNLANKITAAQVAQSSGDYGRCVSALR